jgi:hypothetical protein
MSTIEKTQFLTPHFTLGEMTCSVTCDRLGMVNYMPEPEVIIPRLTSLCEHVLEPLRQAFGPIIINSGYRSECLNYVVGGVDGSQHCLGEAADIRTPTMAIARSYYDFIRRNLTFDQLLLERHKKSGLFWVHVSYTERRPNRGQAIEI